MLAKKRLPIADSRRLFLKKSAQASAGFILLQPIKNLFAFSNLNKDQPTWNELIDYARWCPTVHNLQPHKIKIISATEAALYYDPNRLLPVEDPNAIFVTVAMGVFLEHLSIAAAFFNKKVEITGTITPIQNDKKELTLFARLKLVSYTGNEELNRGLMLTRKTSRMHYNGKPLRQETINKIKNEAEKFNHEIFSSSEKEFVDDVIKLNQETLFEDISSNADRKELSDLFRYSENQAKELKDGLWSRCMCVPGAVLKSVFQHPEKWMGLKKEMLSAFYKNLFHGTATVCWIGGKFNDTDDWLQAGRMLARSWLFITRDNAYMHPFGSLITNVNAYKKINEKFAQPANGKKIWMIFRAGYSKEPARSFRLSTEEILIT